MVTAPGRARPVLSVNGTQLKAPVALAVAPSPTRSTEFVPLAKKAPPFVGVFESNL